MPSSFHHIRTEGIGRTATLIDVLHHRKIQAITLNGHRLEEQVRGALKRAQAGEMICLVLGSLVSMECNACEKLAPLIVSATPSHGDMDIEFDEQRIRDNLRIVFIVDEGKFDTLIPEHFINYFSIIHCRKWSRDSVKQGLEELGPEVSAVLSSVEYDSTRQVFQVKNDFNKIYGGKSHERRQRMVHLTSGLATLEKTVKAASELKAALSEQGTVLEGRNQRGQHKTRLSYFPSAVDPKEAGRS